MWWQFVCWFSMGIPFLIMGFAMRFGWTNKWYLHTQIVPYMPSATAYCYFPVGLILSLPPIILGLPIDASIKSNLVFMAWGICFLLTAIFPIWKPNFLKPKWLVRLEARYPPEAIEVFKREWKKMDRDEWAHKIGTEAGMEELIKRVTNKYGEYDPQQKSFVKTTMLH